MPSGEGIAVCMAIASFPHLSGTPSRVTVNLSNSFIHLAGGTVTTSSGRCRGRCALTLGRVPRGVAYPLRPRPIPRERYSGPGSARPSLAAEHVCRSSQGKARPLCTCVGVSK